MSKELIGFGKPAFKEGMTEDERKKAEADYIKSVMLDIKSKTTLLADASEEEICAVVDNILEEA